jgi:hypothetical protein
VELRVLDGELNLLQSRANRGDQEGRQRKSERIGGEGEVAAHRRWRNRPTMPADERRFGERFLGD